MLCMLRNVMYVALCFACCLMYVAFWYASCWFMLCMLCSVCRHMLRLICCVMYVVWSFVCCVLLCMVCYLMYGILNYLKFCYVVLCRVVLCMHVCTYVNPIISQLGVKQPRLWSACILPTGCHLRTIYLPNPHEPGHSCPVQFVMCMLCTQKLTQPCCISRYVCISVLNIRNISLHSNMCIYNKLCSTDIRVYIHIYTSTKYTYAQTGHQLVV